MKKLNRYFMLVPILALATSCAVIRPGEVGFKQRAGVLKPKAYIAGMHMFNPFVSKFIKINTRTVEAYNELIVPSKEGLSVKAELSLLYHVKPESTRDVYIKFGTGYEEIIIMSNFRAITREVCAKYSAKELYATSRENIEKAIFDNMTGVLSPYGIVVDAVLLKDIFMPDQITKAIQNKVEAEQAAQQMEFVIEKQKKEAERMLIEAEAIKKSQLLINEALDAKALQYRKIEMLKQLNGSPNAKVIIMDTKTGDIILDAK